MRKFAQLVIILSILLIPFQKASAQDPTPPADVNPTSITGPIYIVQSGDSIISIAGRFGITKDELLAANSIADPNLLKIGDELIIPGLPGMSGYLLTETVGFGNTLSDLTIKNMVPREMLVKLNHITSPAELYAGVNLIIPQQTEIQAPTRNYLLSAGQSTLEFAVLAGISPWALQKTNELSHSWDGLPGQPLYLPVGTEGDVTGLLTNPLDRVFISPLPMEQGSTVTISVRSDSPAAITGSLTDHPLTFLQSSDNNYVALQGIHAMQEPGAYPLTIQVTQQDGSVLQYEQQVIVNDGYFPQDPVINVKDEFIDPAITQPELDWLTQQTAPVNVEKYWEGVWTSPSPFSYTECLNSRYGNRRSYNGGPYEYFHTGVDFCGGDGVKIFAPARGKVIFAGPLTVRGNATIIDHGWGVYSGYWHQNTIEVNVGDIVEAGQEIGLVGGTGRVTGAHLHWEIWAGGVQVEPINWLENEYPATPEE